MTAWYFLPCLTVCVSAVLAVMYLTARCLRRVARAILRTAYRREAR